MRAFFQFFQSLRFHPLPLRWQGEPGIPLRLALILPLGLQVLIGLGLSGYLASRNEQQTINLLAAQLLLEKRDRLQENVASYLATPVQITQQQVAAIQLGVLDWRDRSQLERYFAQQLAIVHHNAGQVSSIAISNEQRWLAVEKANDASVWAQIREASTQFRLQQYQLNSQGDRNGTVPTQLSAPQSRLWPPSSYQTAKTTGKAVWQLGGVELKFPNQPQPLLDLRLTYEQPFFVDRTFQGVISAAVPLSQLTHFLKRLSLGQTGQAFILERNGQLVATSSGESLLSAVPDLALRSGNLPPESRRPAIASQNPLTRAAIQALQAKIGQWQQIDHPLPFEFQVQGQQYFAQIVPLSAENLDWLAVLVVPETAFAATLNRRDFLALWLCLAALLGTIGVGLFIAHQIAQPIRRLSSASQALAQGNPIAPLPETRGMVELRGLSQALNQITQQLQHAAAQHKQTLPASETTFTQLFQTHPDPIALTRIKDGHYLEVNEQGLKFIGSDRAAVLGQVATELGLGQTPAQQQAFLERLAANDNCLSLEWQPQSVGNETATLLLTVVPVVLAGQHCLLWIGKEITDRKQAEAALENRIQQLLRITDALPIYVAYFDRQQRYQFVNQIYETRFGRARHTFYGKSIQEIVGTVDSAISTAYLEQALSGHLTTYAIEQPDSDGRLQHLEVTLVPDFASDMQVQGCHSLVIDITARKQAEEALRLSEQRFRNAFDTTAVGMDIVSTAGKFLQVNASACRILGYTEAELLALTYFDVTHPQDVTLDQNYAPKLLAGEIDFYHLEKRYIHKSGHTIWGLLSVSLVRDRDGTPLYFVSQLQDISQRKQAEAALRESEAKFRGAFDNTAIGMSLTAPDGRFLQVNAALCQMYGYAEFELLDKRFQDITHPDDLGKNLNLFHQALSGKISHYEMEKRYIHKTGQIIWGFMSVSVVRDRTGAPLYSVTQVQDITQRKQMEAALQQSESRFQSVGDAAPGIIFTVVLQPNNLLRFEYLSAGFEEIYEVSVAAGLADASIAANQIHPDDRASYWAALLQSRDAFVPFVHEWRIMPPSGTLKWLRVNSRPEVRQNGETVWHGVAIDISQRKQAELELTEAKEAAEAANCAKSIFLANMSHELRTPLNAILGFAQLLSWDTQVNQTQQNYLETINRNGEHLLQLINDILSISKIEADRITLEETQFSLDAMLDRLQEFFQLRAHAKGLTLQIDRAATVPSHIQADERKLREILTNLLDNAIKFTPHGSITLRISTAPTLPPPIAGSHWLQLDIEDTGFGIAPEEMPLLFEPFAQTQTGRQIQQGTGLGLPICRRFVQLMGGEISVQSTVNVGTIFQIKIPVQWVTDEMPQAQARRVAGLAPGQPNYRILVVDDAEENRLLLVKRLEMTGFAVQSTSNGQQAIALWNTDRPHLIWMDLRLPELDGYAVTRHIRQAEAQAATALDSMHPSATLPPSQPCKIIAITASIFEAEQQRALAAGCDDFVSKPCAEATFFGKMSQHLGVQYRYATPHPTPPRKLDPSDNQPDYFDALQTMPAEWIAALHLAARSADEDSILQLLQQIPTTQRPLRQAIAKLVENFELQQLIDLIDRLPPLNL